MTWRGRVQELAQVVVVSEAYCCSLTREQGSHLLFLLAFYPTGPFACASNKLHNIRLYT